MVKHTQTTCRENQTHSNNLSGKSDELFEYVCGHFVGFELKGLSIDLILDSIVYTGQQKSLDANE